jgi:hypothetical protein
MALEGKKGVYLETLTRSRKALSSDEPASPKGHPASHARDRKEIGPMTTLTPIERRYSCEWKRKERPTAYRW